MFLFQPKPKRQLIGFEDMKIAIQKPSKYIIINTFEQDVVIKNTVRDADEERVINDQLNNYNSADLPIIVYGRNSCDVSVEQKQTQLTALGITEIYIYAGGLFEWLLLQEVYSADEFPTISQTPIDILRYRPKVSAPFA
jgi:hypothetical protein